MNNIHVCIYQYFWECNLYFYFLKPITQLQSVFIFVAKLTIHYYLMNNVCSLNQTPNEQKKKVAVKITCFTQLNVIL